MSSAVETVDLTIVGAGAAGIATAIFAARAMPSLSVRCVDGARRIGAKILVSGGARCNVTNREVTERDFWGGSPRAIRSVLRAFPAPRVVAFFAALGVELHEEEDGKLFPNTNRSRTVLDALIAEANRLGVVLATGQRVVDVRRGVDRFEVETEAGSGGAAATVVLATGGRSLPKSGSDGFGYELARRLGHGHVLTTPALAPLLLDGDRHARLAGVSHPATLTVRVDGGIATRLEGPMLWTHFGASGPVILNASRHWHRARLTGAPVEVILNVCPGGTFDSVDTWLQREERTHPRSRVTTILATRVPAALADVLVDSAGVEQTTTMAHLQREDR